MLDEDAVHAAIGKCPEFVAQARDARRRKARIPRARREKFAGVGLEGHHSGSHAQRVGRAAQFREQRAVAPMHAVEITDRNRAGRAGGGAGETTIDTHGGGSWATGSKTP